MNTNQLDFKPFAQAVAKKFEEISKMGTVLFVNVGYDDLWETYLASFPPGTNEVFRERTHHDGSYDKNFIRRVGKTVGIDNNNNIHTIWDIDTTGVDTVYQMVASELSKAVLAAVPNEFAFYEDPKIGYEETTENLASGGTITWNHFYAYIPKALQQLTELKLRANETVEMYLRAKAEFSLAVLDTVESLIVDSGLYRGTEYLDLLTGFKSLVLNDNESYAYRFTKIVPSKYARIRNTVIGTLLTDIASDMDITTAVFRYESKMDPASFKRPRAIVTEKMKNEAMKFITDEGLEDSLHRKHASLSEIPVTEVLWVSGDAATKLKPAKDDVLSILTSNINAVPKTLNSEMTFEDFTKNIMPSATNIELLVENRHQNNLMSLVAPKFPSSKSLFSWNNGFSWSYKGELTDSIVERVKKAGGATNGALRVSLSWSNRDDLDLYCYTPSGAQIYFGNRANVLDVDMNVSGESTTPVENMNFTRLENGEYRFLVNNHRKRATDNVGFDLQVAYSGKSELLSYANNEVRVQRELKACVGVIITVKDGEVSDVKPLQMTSDSRPIEVWGMSTQTYVQVDTIMNSPNHWGDNASGNKHLFFISSQIKNNEPVRGFYNEFLTTKYHEHKRVFELLSAKMVVPVAEEQVSGLGFSATRKDSVTVRVNNKRVFKLTF